jgi:hypothetical protein
MEYYITKETEKMQYNKNCVGNEFSFLYMYGNTIIYSISYSIRHPINYSIINSISHSIRPSIRPSISTLIGYLVI